MYQTGFLVSIFWDLEFSWVFGKVGKYSLSYVTQMVQCKMLVELESNVCFFRPVVRPYSQYREVFTVFHIQTPQVRRSKRHACCLSTELKRVFSGSINTKM